MILLNILFCFVAALSAGLGAFGIKRNLAVPLSYLFFSLSPLTDFIDIIGRAKSGDTGGITDIYPTFFICYLILLACITAVNIIGARMTADRK